MKLFGVFQFSRIDSGSWFGLHVEVKSWTSRRGEVLWSDKYLIFWWEDSWDCIRGCASSLLKPIMVFSVLYSDLIGPSWRHLEWREPVSWRVSVVSWWVLLEVIWNGVSFSCWVVDTFVGWLIWYCFSSGEWWEGMYGVFHLESWAEVWNQYNWYWSLERFASGDDKLNLDLVWSLKINCMCAADLFCRNRFRLLAKSRSCVDFTEIVCRFRSERSSRDRVSISPDVHWSSTQI